MRAFVFNQPDNYQLRQLLAVPMDAFLEDSVLEPPGILREWLLREFAFVGVTDYLQEGVDALSLLMHWLPTTLPKWNQSDFCAQLPEELRAEVRQKNRFDDALYRTAADIFALQQKILQTSYIPAMVDSIFGRRDQDPPKRVIFLHVPKVGGTTVGNFLERSAKELRLRFFHTFEGHDLSMISPDDRARLDLLYGHISFTELSMRYANELFPASFIILLRNPRERVISTFYYIQNNPHHPQYKEFVNATLSQKLRQGWLPSSLAWLGERFFLAQMILERATVVGVTERMEETFEVMCCKIPWLRHCKEVKTYNLNENRPAIDQVDPAILELIDSRSEEERKIYKLAETRLDILLKECRSAKRDGTGEIRSWR
jgi:hypothetical protein